MTAPAVAVRLQNVSKYYKLYDSKRDRFREAFDLRRRKRHHEFYALRGIDLEVKKGEILGVVGRNGAGKSTLLKILSGVIQANGGRVEVNGRVSALLELGSGLNPNLDGIQNIYFGGIMMGFSREEMKRRLEVLLGEPPRAAEDESGRRRLDAERTEHTLTWTDPRTKLQVRCVAIEYHGFPTVEWTVYFKNAGRADTPIIESIRALDVRLEREPGCEFLLRHAVGSPSSPGGSIS